MEAAMIALIQRVANASVTVGQQRVAQIDHGLLAFIGVERNDDTPQADRLLQRVLSYRVFEDETGRMNRSLADTGGGLLLVSQFTLVADTRKGNRPGFSRGADPDRGRMLFHYLVDQAGKLHQPVASGVFGAHMQVALVNDGPVTFWLQVPCG